jgi:hypothetical protein
VEKLLNTLNKAQLEAVLHAEGPSMVLTLTLKSLNILIVNIIQNDVSHYIFRGMSAWFSMYTALVGILSYLLSVVYMYVLIDGAGIRSGICFIFRVFIIN